MKLLLIIIETLMMKHYCIVVVDCNYTYTKIIILQGQDGLLDDFNISLLFSHLLSFFLQNGFNIPKITIHTSLASIMI